MLVLGVIVAALVVPYVMELLFNVYGLTSVLPFCPLDRGHGSGNLRDILLGRFPHERADWKGG